MAFEPVNLLQNPGCCEMSARRQLNLRGTFKSQTRYNSCSCGERSNSKTKHTMHPRFSHHHAVLASNLRARRGAREDEAIGETQSLLARTTTDFCEGHTNVLRVIVVRVVIVQVPSAVIEGSGLAGCGGGEVAAEDQWPIVRPTELRGVRSLRAVVGEAVEAAAGVCGIEWVAVQVGLAAALPDVLVAAVQVALRGVVQAHIIVEREDILACTFSGG